jgi:hypothetical protein
LFLITSGITPAWRADITNPARQDAADTFMGAPEELRISMPAASRNFSARDTMKDLVIGLPSLDLNAAFFPRTLIDCAAARCLYSVNKTTGSKLNPFTVPIAMAGIETKSFLVFGEGTSIKTKDPVCVARMETAAPDKTGLSDFG